ncbi:MAG: insulinase family protein [Bacilli bacterium]|nr:insulinase family protein [Bacilli bacterium]
MNCKTIKVNNINIHFIKTNKFKTTLVSFNFTNKYTKDDYLKRALLFRLLTESTKNFNSKVKLEIESQNLYINSYTSHTNIIGNYIKSSIDLLFINNKYSEKNNDMNCLNFLKDIIINPDINNNQFNSKSFNNIYNIYKTAILSYNDDPRSIAEKECFKETDINNPINSKYIDIDELERVTNSDVVDYYNSSIMNDRVDVFVIGEYNEKKYIDFFNKLNIGKNLDINDIEYEYNEYRDNINKVIKQDNRFKQANLFISYKIINTNKYEKNYLLPIFNIILGGGPSSRLFMNVREKNSLAYHISSKYQKEFSILLITSGIDYCNYDKAIKLVNEQFDNMKEITIKELEIAKKLIISDVKTTFDYKQTINSYNYNNIVLNEDNINDYINNIKNVEKKEIEELISKIKIDTISLVYGE